MSGDLRTRTTCNLTGQSIVGSSLLHPKSDVEMGWFLIVIFYMTRKLIAPRTGGRRESFEGPPRRGESSHTGSTAISLINLDGFAPAANGKENVHKSKSESTRPKLEEASS